MELNFMAGSETLGTGTGTVGKSRNDNITGWNGWQWTEATQKAANEEGVIETAWLKRGAFLEKVRVRVRVRERHTVYQQI